MIIIHSFATAPFYKNHFFTITLNYFLFKFLYLLGQSPVYFLKDLVKFDGSV